MARDLDNIMPARDRVKKFLMRLSSGQNRLTAFKECFPISESWSNTKIYNHINAIVSKKASQNQLKHYRERFLNMMEQKKVDMLMYLEQQIIYNEDNPNISIGDKIRAIECFSKIAGFDKTPTVVNNLLVTDRSAELNQIFGISDNNQLEHNEDVIDAEITDEE
jgi:hypothetical protein